MEGDGGRSAIGARREEVRRGGVDGIRRAGRVCMPLYY